MSEIERGEVKVALTERVFIDGDGGGGGAQSSLMTTLTAIIFTPNHSFENWKGTPSSKQVAAGHGFTCHRRLFALFIRPISH